MKNGQAPLLGSLPSSQKLHLSIMLPVRNQSGLDQLLKELYDPSSPMFRQFLSQPQFTQRFGPTEKDYQAVLDFASANGFTVTNTPANRLILSMDGTARQVEQTFHVHINLYHDPRQNRSFFAPDREPSLALSVPVKYVAGLTNVSVPHPMFHPGASGGAGGYQSGTSPTGTFYPSDMRTAYYGGSALTGNGQCVGIGEFQGYNIQDVVNTLQENGRAQASYTTSGNNYILSYTPPGSNSPNTIQLNNVLLDGGSVIPTILPNSTQAPNARMDSENAEEEVVIDISEVIAMAPGLSQIELFIAPFDEFNHAPDVIAEMAGQGSGQALCSQLALPWEWSPSGYGNASTYLDNVFENIETSGQGLFVSTGDYGSWPVSGYYNYFPADDPYVIAVGGTVLQTSDSGQRTNETAWPSSSGGVSPDNLPILSYQYGVETSCNHASTTLRNAPDVAMEAGPNNYACGDVTPYPNCSQVGSGTSIATSLWAGFMALTNEYAYKNGYAPTGAIGSIQDVIYTVGRSSSYTQNMHDITSGNNGAYVACPGYDLVTGLGSPNGQNTIYALSTTTPTQPLQAPEPYEYNVNVTLQGTAPPTSITTTMTLGDSSPGANITYQTVMCGSPSAPATVPSGTTLTFVNYCPSMQMSGTMYANAHNYGQSQSTSMSF